jgi:hypothetical protein
MEEKNMTERNPDDGDIRNPAERRRRRRGHITFLMGPGACPDDPAEEKLLREHEAEADRHGAEFWNYGAFLEHYALSSKTSNGYLYSKIDPAKMKVTHYWD